MISFPTNNAATGYTYSVNPSGRVTQRTDATVEDWLKNYFYDNTLSVAGNIVQAVANGSFPTAYPITLKKMVFELPPDQRIVFPENVTLKNCQVTSGKVCFHHGTADAIGRLAVVVACGSDATANSRADGANVVAKAFGATANATVPNTAAHAVAFGAIANAMVEKTIAYATAFGATANATAAWSEASATVSGSTANATKGSASASAKVSGATANATAIRAYAFADASGATANAIASCARAFAMVSGTTANATANYSEAFASALDSTANATTNGAKAVAEKAGATANATANGARATTDAPGTIVNATTEGAKAIASVAGSIAIASHKLAEVNVEHVEAKMIKYNEFTAIRLNLDKFLDKNENGRERAGAAFLVGMAFCDGKDVKQSDKFATFFLSLAHELGHPNAAFELGELYSKKRSWLRQDVGIGDGWYSKETSEQKKVRELTQNYGLLLRSAEDANSSLYDLPKDVINTIGSFLSRL
jgi:hypothetical protein